MRLSAWQSLAVGLAIIALALGLTIGSLGHVHASAIAARQITPEVKTCDTSCPTEPFWGVNLSLMALAVDQNHAAWPQKRDYWCGVADLTALNWYDQMKTFGTGVSPQYRTQDSIGDDTRGHVSPDGEVYNPDPSNGLLNATPAAFSPWGPANSIVGHGPAFKANIAPDAGTDPRSLAWGAWTMTPNGYYFHNWIYATDNNTATYDFASDFGPAHGINDPIIVDINQGAHSFLVDGVYSQTDPSAGGENLTAIDTWDPAYGSRWGAYNSSQQEVWDIYSWENKYFPTSNSYLFKLPYSSTANGGYDPEPTTQPGYYNPNPPNVNHHWDNAFVTIEQDMVTRCNASPDIAYDQNGAEVAHTGATYCP